MTQVTPKRGYYLFGELPAAEVTKREAAALARVAAKGFAPTDRYTTPSGARLLPVPDLQQHTDYNCGPSALRSVLALYGDGDIDEAAISRAANTSPTEGTEAEDLAAAARKLGLEVTPQLSGSALTVRTQEAAVRVMGTAFSVSRSGAGQQTITRVHVTRGQVEVSPHDNSGVRNLHAGESVEITSPCSGPGEMSPAAAGVDGAAVVPVAEAATAPVASDADVAKAAARLATRSVASKAAQPVSRDRAELDSIRGEIHRGATEGARQLIEAARVVSTSEVELAELALLEAESYLAERKYGRAIDAYLNVAQRHPGTGQSDAASFAAAQVALQHPEAGRDPLSLLQRYLQEHPSGQFARQAATLLRALESPP